MKIFYDVDTQNDFMNKSGALYVPDAELIKPNLRLLTNFAVEKAIPIFGSVDAHSENDPEFKVFPPHCIVNTYGQEKIPQTFIIHSPHDVYIGNRISSSPDTSLRMAFSEIRDYQGKDYLPFGVFFEKQHYDVFTNPNFERFLGKSGINEVVVYGVATDYCVKTVVLGMQKKGIQCYIVEDAIKGVAPDTTSKALEEMLTSGAKFITTKQVLEEKI